MENTGNLCMGCMTNNLDPGGKCRNCGVDEKSLWTAPHHLKPRSVLNNTYIVGKVLGEGGFGITYVGWDIKLSMKVAIKEYYPNGFVTRDTAHDGTVHSYGGGEKQEFYEQGRERFIDEARRLAKFFGLPGIVSVKDCFDENGTAYIVMEFIEGANMRTVLDKMGGIMPESETLEMMKPLIKSLGTMHKSSIIHRDIAPDNIMIQWDGSVKLIDFGAAREVDSDAKSSVAIMKHGYAPEEQYDSKRLRQGPWTDVYALCATIYRALQGEPPPDAIDRLRGETIKDFTVPVSDNTREAVMKGLAMKAEDRWQNVDELAEKLYGKTDSVSVPPVVKKNKPAESVESNQPGVQGVQSGQGQEKDKKRKTILVAAFSALGFLGLVALCVSVIIINMNGKTVKDISSESIPVGAVVHATQGITENSTLVFESESESEPETEPETTTEVETTPEPTDPPTEPPTEPPVIIPSVITLNETSGKIYWTDDKLEMECDNYTPYVSERINITVRAWWVANSLTFTATVGSADSTDPSVTVTTSDPSLLTVSETRTGNVTLITVTSKDILAVNTAKNATVTVKSNANPSLTATYNVTVSKNFFSYEIITGNRNVIRYYPDGRIIAVGSGVTTLSIKSASGKTAVHEIDVQGYWAYPYDTKVRVNFRKEHNTNAEIFFVIDPQVYLYIYDYYCDDEYIWGNTTYNGKTGWLAMFVVKEIK